MKTARTTKTSYELLRDAAGTPRAIRGKIVRLSTILAGYVNKRRLGRRLQRLHDRGHVEKIPTRLQIAVGGIDMLRFWISPAAADYYEQQGINYTFHQVLRFLDEPASLADPVGLFSTRDGIIGHLMQVVHANPVYDLQLLDMFDDGLDELEKQLEQMIAGTHQRAISIRAIVEEADYHLRLQEFLRRWRKDPTIDPLLRSNVENDERYRALEAIFGSMTTAFRYFCQMPNSMPRAVRHLRTVTDPLPIYARAGFSVASATLSIV
jgi:hypothetical protein